MARSPSRKRPLLLALAAVLLAFVAVADRTKAADDTAKSQAPDGPRRLHDDAAVLPPNDAFQMEKYLGWIFEENGADIHIAFVRDVPNGDLETYSLRLARELGIGRESDRRGMLFVYDMAGEHLRIEVGPRLEDVFTDGFVGYLMREHARAFFAARNPSMGLRLTLFMIQYRMREASLGMTYDPAAVSFITDSVRLAAGAGATARVALGGDSSLFLSGQATPAEQAYFAEQPTVDAAFHRYLEWLRDGRFLTDVSLFTEPSQAFLKTLPMTPAYNAYILYMEYGRGYTVDERGDMALLTFTNTPFASPHFFHRSARGWQLDLSAELRDTKNLVAGPFTWTLAPVRRGDGYSEVFADRWVDVMGTYRLSGGDNRLIPIRGSSTGR